MHQSALPEPDAEEHAHSARLAAAIRAEIEAQGPMPFARFMERCLYAPGLGYYSAGRHKFGREGDFVTAPELGEIFGRCLARALAPTLAALGEGADLLELGGGSGALAETLLRALDARGALPRHYLMLEPSADLRQRQQQRLQAALPEHLLARLAWIERPPEQHWDGIVLANEVIDALPTTRFTLRDGEVLEEHVVPAADGFTRHDQPADPLVRGAVRAVERSLGTPLADGYRSEILPQLPWWLQAVAGQLQRGALWFIDYGYTRREFYHPERSDGTVLAHYRHRAHDDVLRWPGLQDITASVDFTALAEAGTHAGFRLAAYLSQARFLLASGLAEIHAELMASSHDAGDTYALGQEIKRLTLPGQMGERFKVMALARGLDPAALPGAVLAASMAGRLGGSAAENR